MTSQQAEHTRGQIAALDLDIRQAHADGDLAGVGILTQRRDELALEISGLFPEQRPGQ